jgi:trimethylamine:corrinoid methyltransferase-like protein
MIRLSSEGLTMVTSSTCEYVMDINEATLPLAARSKLGLEHHYVGVRHTTN